jgi:hypothetical protein
MKNVLLIFLSLAMAAAATDYFPFGKGNVWNYSYESRFTVATAEMPTTRDSGGVRWEVLNGLGNSVAIQTYILQTYSLAHRTYSVYPDTQPVYDSVFSPPRITVDTIVFRQGVVLTDTGRIFDSTTNAISFSGADCPVTIHNPEKPLPAELGIKDTAVQFNGSTLACKKTIPSECSCLDINAWSFIIADSIGPVETSITRCPGLIGTGFFETRRLLQREYPTAVRFSSSDISQDRQISILYRSNRIYCKTPSGLSHQLSVTVYNASGRKIKHFSGMSPGTMQWNIGSVPQGVYLIRVRTAAGSVSKKIYVQK